MNEEYRIVQYSMPDGSIFDQIERIEPYGAIPNDVNNCDYMNYLAWVDKGNIAKVIPAKVEEKTVDAQTQISAIMKSIEAINAKLDKLNGA